MIPETILETPSRPEWSASADTGPSRDGTMVPRTPGLRLSTPEARPTTCRSGDGRIYQRTGKVWLLVSAPSTPTTETRGDPDRAR